MGIRLEAITPADIAHIHRGLSHPEVIRYYAVRFMTLEATQEQMNWYSTIEHEGTGKWWAIRWEENGDFLGAIGLNNIHPVHKRCELGYWLLPEHWGKGIVREALGRVLDHAFNTLGLHRVMAEVETENAASARVLSKNGFRHEGTLRECEWKDGGWVSLDVYAKLAPVQP
jgi:ribosomal-protein-alanine N-acetyltransferase